jgi:hypothetical protein
MSSPTLSFAVTVEDEAILARVGIPAARDGVHTWSFVRIDEIVSLLDREAERGDAAAADLAAYLLFVGEEVYWDMKRDVQQASL